MAMSHVGFKMFSYPMSNLGNISRCVIYIFLMSLVLCCVTYIFIMSLRGDVLLLSPQTYLKSSQNHLKGCYIVQVPSPLAFQDTIKDTGLISFLFWILTNMSIIQFAKLGFFFTGPSGSGP